jgi:hypothetical protein
MPNEEHRHTVGTLRSEHELQNQLREKARRQTACRRRNSRDDEYPSDGRCQQISSDYYAERETCYG